jgi:hypothetical protein
VSQIQRQIDNTRRAYDQRVADLRSRRDLSKEGLARQLAAAKIDADRTLKKLRQQQRDEVDGRRERLTRTLFGSNEISDGSRLLAQRDALAQADGLNTPEDAGKMLRVARLSGDVLLARAVGARAYDMIRSSVSGRREAWGNVVSQWAGDDQDIRTSVDELLEIDGIGPSRGKALTERFLNSMRATAARPIELKDAPDLHRLAAEADQHPDEQAPPEPAAWFRFRG